MSTPTVPARWLATLVALGGACALRADPLAVPWILVAWGAACWGLLTWGIPRWRVSDSAESGAGGGPPPPATPSPDAVGPHHASAASTSDDAAGTRYEWSPTRAQPAASVRAAVLAALAVRAVVVVSGAVTLSDDVYRYVWEGFVLRAGFNPFVHAPDSAALEPLRGVATLDGTVVWPMVAHASIPTIYPPGALALFAMLAPLGEVGWRVLGAACDLGTVALLARVNPRAGWLWALLPLPVLETASSGHLEGPGVLLWLLAMGVGANPTRGRQVRPLYAWLGATVKVLPGVLLLRAGWTRALLGTLAGVALLLPYGTTTAAQSYTTRWAFNGSVFPLAEYVLGAATRPLLVGVGALIVGWGLLRVRDPARLALLVSGALVCLSPVVHPWYVLWPLAAALAVGPTRAQGWRAWELLAVLVPLSYVVLATYDARTSSWHEGVWSRWVIYLPFYAALVREGWVRAWTAGG